MMPHLLKKRRHRQMTGVSDSLVLGIDLGGTKILTAVTNSQGTILARDHSVTPAAHGPDAVVQAVIESVQRSVNQTGLGLADMTAIGVGAPGPSNPQLGILHSAPNLPGWHDVLIRDIIEQALGPRTFLINDANAAALAEFHYGAGRGACCFIYVTVSTGIGGGIVINGEVYTGSVGLASELGHMTIEDEGPLCNCGNHGCWEALASGTALAKHARLRIAQGRPSILLEYTGGDIDQVTAPVIHQAAQAGDELARELLARTSHYLGTGFANLINLFNPDIMAVGGGLTRIGDMLLSPAYAAAKMRAFPAAYEAVRFLPAQLGRNSGVIGAATYALMQVTKMDG